tara:strand:- start:91 stop:570 length:480 start_codon:yes stop_codon:yes gene_type:complete
MNDFSKNKIWEETQQEYVLPYFKKILNCNIELSTFDDDVKNATDLIITKGNYRLKCGLRIRNIAYLNYNDITIRSRSKCGSATEIDKLKNTDRIIYCNVNDLNKRVIRYVILDAKATYNLLHDLPLEEKRNKNAGTYFKIIPMDIARKNKLITKEHGYI